MNHKIIFFFVLFILILSCSTIDKKSEHVKTILLKRTKDIQPLSSFISELEYVELQANENNLTIRKIEGIKLIGDDIILSHLVKRKIEYLRFSRDGKFLNRIGQIAEGANELNEPRDVVQYNDGYAIWDKTGIQEFSKSGIYREKLFDVNFTGTSFFYFKNRFYLFHKTEAPGYLSEYTSDGTLKNVFKPNTETYPDLGYSTIAKMETDSFHLFTPLNDTVFSFIQNQLLPKYIFKGKSFPTYQELLQKVGDRDTRERIKFFNHNRHWEIKTYLENSNFIFMVYQLGSYPVHLIIRKSDWQTIYMEQIINDIDGGIWDDPVYLAENNELYIPLSAYQITTHKMKNKKRNAFDELIQNTESNGNPVLMKCRLK